MNKQTAQRAARWWADLLRQGGHWDQEIEERMQTSFPEMAAEMDESNMRLSQHWQEMAEMFEKALAQVLLDPPKSAMRGCVYFGVDYNPADDPILAKAADLSFLHLTYSALPRKTDMRIANDIIEVRRGYAAEWETLY